MRKFISILFSGAFLATTLVSLTPSPASASATLITCTDLTTQKTVALKELQKSCKSLLAPALWHIQQSDSAAHSGNGYASLHICSSKNPKFTYQFIKKSCPKYQVSTDYWRSATLPAKPVITEVSSYGHESAFLTLASESATNTDAPITYYTITSSKGDVMKVYSWRDMNVIVSGLSSSTSYTFTITATSVDGTSPVSASSLPVTTQTYVAPVTAATSAPLAAPAFTLSASAETKTVNTAATGFTILSTGGAIASFAISATPAGMVFSTSTGVLTGTPTTVAGATTYTITATNASGSGTQTFTLTVDIASQTTLNITSLTTNTKAYPYSQALSITTSGGSGSGATTYEIASGGSASGCTLSGLTATDTITANTSGTCLIQASKAADAIYSLATSATSIFTFIKATPILSNSTSWFDGLMKNYDDVPFDVGTPTVANDLAGIFTFTSLNRAVATISGRTVTIVGSGGYAAIQATFTPTDTANYLSGRFIRMNIYVTANLGDA